MFKGIKKADDNDLIILSDEDEIPNPEKIKEFNSAKYKFGIFLQKLYCYKFNIHNLSEAKNGWPGSRICLKKNIKSFFKFKVLKIKNKKEPFWKIYKEKNIQSIKDGGWHFTYLMKPKLISQKIKNSGHIEFNERKFTSISTIKYKIKNLIDPFDRKFKLKKININKTFPNYIIKNKKKFKSWIL